MKEFLEIRRFDGESARIANEDKPDYLFQKMENLRPSVKVGSAIKRDPYDDKITTGLTSLQTMKEFTDDNGTATLAIIDNDGFETQTNAAGEYSAGSFTDNNDGTIDGDNTELIAFNNEIRGGVGIRTAGNGDIPLWFGYIDARNRFNDEDTITAGLYLEKQLVDYYEETNLTLEAVTSKDTSRGVEQGTYFIYWSYELDGYQKGMPIGEKDYAVSGVSYLTIDSANQTLKINVALGTNTEPRITGVNVFVGYLTEEQNLDLANYNELIAPAYFLERIDMNDQGDYFCEQTGTLSYAAQTIVITGVADWLTFDPTSLWLRDEENSKDYYISSVSYINAGADLQITLNAGYGDAIASGDDGDTPLLRFYSQWGGAFGGTYFRKTFYDSFYKELGAEMYSYLNIPVGDEGIGEVGYKYIAWNGDNALYSGFADKTHSYYSVVNSPDIVPSSNVIRHKSTVRGLTNIGQDFLVFTDKGIERLRIAGNQNSYRDEEYSNAVLVSNKAKAKINDDIIMLMSYNGPVLIENRNVNTEIGWHLREWWHDNFTQAQLEACVVGYNFKEEEVWFSFPTYTASPYTNGIIFVFDLKAYKQQYTSPWWRVKTDVAVKAFDVNTQFNMIAGSSTKIVDFNTDGQQDESVSTSVKIKVLENPKTGGKVRFDRVYLDYDGNDTVTPDCYIDGSLADNVTPLNDDGCAFLRETGKTLEVDFTTSGSANDLEHKKIQVSYKPLRK